MSFNLFDQNGYPLVCHICGKPATGLHNITVNCASCVPSVMQPVCDEHNPYTFGLVWKGNQTTGKTTAS